MKKDQICSPSFTCSNTTIVHSIYIIFPSYCPQHNSICCFKIFYHLINAHSFLSQWRSQSKNIGGTKFLRGPKIFDFKRATVSLCGVPLLKA